MTLPADEAAFAALFERHRREIHLHCVQGLQLAALTGAALMAVAAAVAALVLQRFMTLAAGSSPAGSR